MHYLEKQLSKMGYHILVKKNGNILYFNISDADMQSEVETAGKALHSAKTMTASVGNISVIKNTFLHEEKEFSFKAAERWNQKNSGWKSG